MSGQQSLNYAPTQAYKPYPGVGQSFGPLGAPNQFPVSNMYQQMFQNRLRMPQPQYMYSQPYRTPQVQTQQPIQQPENVFNPYTGSGISGFLPQIIKGLYPNGGLR